MLNTIMGKVLMLLSVQSFNLCYRCSRQNLSMWDIDSIDSDPYSIKWVRYKCGGLLAFQRDVC